MNPSIIPLCFVAPYNSHTRRIACGIKRGDPNAIFQASHDMAPLVPSGAVLVPTSSHNGQVAEEATAADYHGTLRRYRPRGLPPCLKYRSTVD